MNEGHIMKMYLHLLAAAFVIAPVYAFGMETAEQAPSADVVALLGPAPVAPSSTALAGKPVEQPKQVDPTQAAPATPVNPVVVVAADLQPKTPQAPAAMVPEWQQSPHQGNVMRAVNWLRSFVYPTVKAPRFVMIPADKLSSEDLLAAVKRTARRQNRIARTSMSRRRCLGMLSALEFGALAYILKYCTPLFNRTNALKATGAILAGLVVKPFLTRANRWWNQRVTGQFIAKMKKSELVTQQLAGEVKQKIAQLQEDNGYKALLTRILDQMTKQYSFTAFDQ